MLNVTIGWIDLDMKASENNAPYQLIGRRNISLGSNNDIKIIILEGYEKMPTSYKNNLENLGYTIIDAGNVYQKFSAKYSALDRFGAYEKRCFLRWPVIREVMGSEPLIHYDGDVVFNETPENLWRLLKDYNIVVQGCPAVTSIKTTDWLEVYIKNLEAYCEDISGYSKNAWKQNYDYVRSNFDRWTGIRYRQTISSDQDLIRHLLHIGELPQDEPARIKNRGLMFFENPMFYFGNYPELAPFHYHREGLVDYFNDRKVAFWHMQGFFAGYLKMVYLSRYLLGQHHRIDIPLDHMPGPGTDRYNNLLYKLYPRVQRSWSRQDMCKMFFERKDMAGVFDPQVFWHTPEHGEDMYPLYKKYEKHNQEGDDPDCQ